MLSTADVSSIPTASFEAGDRLVVTTPDGDHFGTLLGVDAAGLWLEWVLRPDHSTVARASIPCTDVGSVGVWALRGRGSPS